MDRRELFGAVGALGAAALAGSQASAGHGDGKAPASPVSSPHFHFCGIHCAKKNPKWQLTTQHYCTGHTNTGHDDIFQCVLYDGTGPNAKMLGVEYVISDAEYRKLPDEEKKYWHNHTYEVLGGGLVAPGMDAESEKKFMGIILTTWGKAWHTWPDPNTAVPVGEPLLIWSITGDGQADEKIVAARDKEFSVDTKAIRERRAKEIGLEVPQLPPPKSMDEIGRQWTVSGDDKPTKK